MSVTFHPAILDTDLVGWVIVHAGTDEAADSPIATYAAGQRALVEHNATCQIEDCVIYGGQLTAVYAADAPQLNVSTTNARHLLAMLGLPADEGHPCGTCAGEDFLGRILLALSVAPADAGVPAHETTPRFVECGRHPGYSEDRLAELRTIAEFCRTHRREVVWA